MGWKKFGAFAAAAGLSLALAACGAGNTDKKAETSQQSSSAVSAVSVTATPTVTDSAAKASAPKALQAEAIESPAAEQKTIGQKQEGENILHLQVINNTGAAVHSFGVQAADDSAEPANLLAAGDTFADGEKRDLYFDATAVREQHAGGDPSYIVRLTAEGDKTYDIANFPLTDTDEVTLKLDGEQPYAEYISKASGQLVTTKEQGEAGSETQQEEESESYSGEEQATEGGDEYTWGGDDATYEGEAYDAGTEEEITYDGAAEWDESTGQAADPNAGCLAGDGMTYGDDGAAQADPNAGCLAGDGMTY